MAACKNFIYLNEQGEKHPAYYNNLHLGHNRAISIYLEAMENVVNTNFSKITSVADLITEGKAIESGIKKGTINRKSLRGGVYKTTDQVKPYLDDEMAAKSVIGSKMSELRRMEYPDDVIWAQLDKGASLAKNEDYKRLADKFFASNPKTFKKLKKEAADNWAKDTEGKSDFHEILEKYVDQRNKLTDKIEIKQLAEKLLDVRYSNSASNAAMYKRSLALSLLTQFEKFLSTKFKNNQDVILGSEVTIDVPEWGKRGKIDLLVYNKKTNEIIIYDYKFYAESAFDNYSTSYGKLLEPVAGSDNSRKVLNDLRMSVYQSMLHKKGIPETALVTIGILPFVITKDPEVKEGGVNSFLAVTMQKPIKNIYQKNDIEQILKKEEVDIEPVTDTWADKDIPDKLSRVSDLSEYLISKSLVKSNIVSFNKKQNIDSIKITQSDNNNFYYYNSIIGTDVMLKGTTKSEWAPQLKAYLDKSVVHRDEMVDLVLDYLYSGKKEWGKKRPRKIKKSSEEIANSMMEQIMKGSEEDDYTANEKLDIEATMTTIMDAKYFKTTGKEEIINTLFGGMGTDTWHFSKLSSDSRFNDVEANIIVARSGNSVKLIALTDVFEPNMKFKHDNKGKYTNILGNFISDSEAKLLGVNTSSNSFNMELLTMGFVMKEMMFMDKSISFQPPKIGRFRGGRGQYPLTMSLTSLDNITNRLLVLIKEDMSPKYLNVLSTKLNIHSNEAQSYIDVAIDAVSNNFDYFFKAGIKDNINLLMHLTRVNLHDGKNTKKLVIELRNLARQIEADASKNKRQSDVYHNDAYNAVNNLLLVLRGIDPKTRESDDVIYRLGLLKNARTMGNIGSKILSQMDFVFSGAKNEVFQEYQDKLSKYNRVVGKLLKSKSITKADLEYSVAIRQSVFKNLYEEWDPSKPSDVKSKMLRFKRPDDPSLESQEEREMIKYMVELQEEMAIRSLGKGVIDDMKETGKYDPRMVFVSKQSASTEADAENWNFGKRVKESVSKLGDRLSPTESSENLLSENFFNYSIFNPFEAQITSTTNRMEVLGYNAEGEITEAQETFMPETNIDIIFEDIVLGTLVKERYEDALAVKAAVDNLLVVNEMRGEAQGTVLKKVLDQFSDIIMLGYSETARHETKSEKGVKNISSSVSALILSGSLSYIMTDSLVNSVNIIGETLTQGLLSIFTDHDPDFGWKDLAWATQFMIKEADLSEAIRFKYGMIVRDPEKLRDPRFRKTMAKLFTGKSLYWLNALPIEMAQGVVMLAKMRREGSLAAHSIDEFGVLTYDETKDKRFFKQSGESISTKEIKRRAAHHKLVKQYLDEEAAGVDEESKFLRAYTNIDIKNIQTMTTERFASLSADQKILWETTAIGIAFTRFKNWLVAKSEVWWRTRNEGAALTHNLELIEDENGEMQYIYVGQINEGILQTMGYLMSYVKHNGKDFSKLELDFGRKKNLARMTVDLSMWFILWLLAQGLFFKDEYTVKYNEETHKLDLKKVTKSKMEQQMMRIYRNATGDLTFVLPMYDTFFAQGSNLFPIMSAFQRILTSGIGIITSIGDTEKDLDVTFDRIGHYLNSAARLSGGVRSVEDFGGWMLGIDD